MIRIPERQAQLDALVNRYLPDCEPEPQANGGRDRHAADLSDEEVIALCRKAKNNAKFSSLFDDGDTGAYDHDDSRADQALVSMFAFYTQDPIQLDRLFRRSAIYRPEKWGKRADYRRRTIDYALGKLGETFSTSSPSLSLRGRDDDDDGAPLAVKSFQNLPKANGPREFCVERLVPERFVTTIYGDGGSAKSVIALSLAHSCARGDKSWLGHDLKPCPALYVDWELDEEEQGRRARQLTRADGDEEPPEDLYYFCAAGRRRGEVMTTALAACEEHRIGLVVLDSAGLAMEGDPGDARDTIGFFRELERFRALGVTVLLVDHQAKAKAGESYQGKTAFGSVYKGNLSRSRLQVEVKDREPGGLTVVVRHNKANFSDLLDSFMVKLSFSEEMIVLERKELAEEELSRERTLNASDRILLALRRGPAFPEDLVAPTGIVIGTVKNTLTNLRRRKLVEATGERQGKAQEIRLAAEGEHHVRDYLDGRQASSSSSSAYRGSDDDDARCPEHDLLGRDLKE